MGSQTTDQTIKNLSKIHGITEGSTNLSLTNARADAQNSGGRHRQFQKSQVTYNPITARARAAISVAGDLSYNSINRCN